MRYTSTINNLKCIEWDLTLSHAFLVDLLVYAPHWAEQVNIKGTAYYWVSRNKVLDEIPHAFKTADSVYRALKVLAEKDIIDYRKSGKKDVVRLTNKGKGWVFKALPTIDKELGKKSELEGGLGKNSEKNPSKLGNNSELSSEKNPTDNGTSFNNGTTDDGEKNSGKISIEDAINHLKVSAILPTFGEVNKSELTTELYKFNQYYIDKGIPEKANAKNLISWFQLIKAEDRGKFTALDKKQAPANAPKIDVSKRFAHLKG